MAFSFWEPPDPPAELFPSGGTSGMSRLISAPESTVDIMLSFGKGIGSLVALNIAQLRAIIRVRWWWIVDRSRHSLTILTGHKTYSTRLFQILPSSATCDLLLLSFGRTWGFRISKYSWDSIKIARHWFITCASSSFIKTRIATPV